MAYDGVGEKETDDSDTKHHTRMTSSKINILTSTNHATYPTSIQRTNHFTMTFPGISLSPITITLAHIEQVKNG